jgi:hypothetical protein
MKPAELYILNRPEPFRTMLMHLQILVESTITDVELKYKWKIPVYYIDNKPLCYFNASLKKGFVDVAFWTSVDLSKFKKQLITEKRKVVKSLRYFTLDDIDEKVLIEILQTINNSNQKGFYKK